MARRIAQARSVSVGQQVCARSDMEVPGIRNTFRGRRLTTFRGSDIDFGYFRFWPPHFRLAPTSVFVGLTVFHKGKECDQRPRDYLLGPGPTRYRRFSPTKCKPRRSRRRLRNHGSGAINSWLTTQGYAYYSSSFKKDIHFRQELALPLPL